MSLGERGEEGQQESRVVIFVSVDFKSIFVLELFHSTMEDGLFIRIF